MPSEESLKRKWATYISEFDHDALEDYIEEFIEFHHRCLDLQYEKADGPVSCPPLVDLPGGLLQSLYQELAAKIEEESCFHLAHIINCLIILCSNHDNITAVSRCDFVSLILALLHQFFGQKQKETRFMTVINSALHLLLRLYDPKAHWRKNSFSFVYDGTWSSAAVAGLHVQVVTFIYEHLIDEELDDNIRLKLLDLLSALQLGSPKNGISVVGPAILEALVTVLEQQRQGNLGSAESVSGMHRQALRCIIASVHILLNGRDSERQIEVGAVLEAYFQLFKRLSGSEEDSLPLMMLMIEDLAGLLQTPAKEKLQDTLIVTGIFQIFIHCLRNNQLSGPKSQILACSIVNLCRHVISGSSTARRKFVDQVGADGLLESLKSIGQPTKPLIQAVLNLVVEQASYQTGSVQHACPIVCLTRWLPDIQCHQHQEWLAVALVKLCASGAHCLLMLCNNGLIQDVINTLRRSKQISHLAVDWMLHLFEELCKQSIKPAELKSALGLLTLDGNNSFVHYYQLLKCLSLITNADRCSYPDHYFDFSSANSAIVVPEFCLSNGFTFHAWINLNLHSIEAERPSTSSVPASRMLYSFKSPLSEFEAFFTCEGILVIVVRSLQDYHVVSLDDSPFIDQQWHCIDIVHSASKSAFSQSQLFVYVDEKLCKKTQLPFPNVTEAFCQNCVGSAAGSESAKPSSRPTTPVQPSRSRLASLLKPIAVASLLSSSSSNRQNAVKSSKLDSSYGRMQCFQGQIGPFCLLNDVLSPAQLPGLSNSFLQDLMAKMIFSYHPKAVYNDRAMDLSGHKQDAVIQVATFSTCSIKNAFAYIGGPIVLFPFIDRLRDEIHVDEPLKACRPDCSYSAEKDSYNLLATMLTLIQKLLEGSTINQDLLFRGNSMAMLGGLIQRAHSTYLTVPAMLKIQYLSETAIDPRLLCQIRQYLLFDFRLWQNSSIDVRIGHIKNLTLLIIKNRSEFRHKFGVQFLLDVLKIYCSHDSPDVKLSSSDQTDIQMSLFKLLKYYVERGIAYEEVSHFIRFLVSTAHSNVVSQCLCLIISLLESPGDFPGSDQIFRLMLEQSTSEPLYVILTEQHFSSTLKEQILLIFHLLLLSPQVNQSCKNSIRLIRDRSYLGLMYNIKRPSFGQLVLLLQNALLFFDEEGIDCAMAVIELAHSQSLCTRLYLSRVLALSFAKNCKLLPGVCKVKAWQQVIIRLLIRTPIEECENNNEETTAVQEESEEGLMDEDSFELLNDRLAELPAILGRFTSLDEEQNFDPELSSLMHRIGLRAPKLKTASLQSELCLNVMVSAFLVMWQGVQQSDRSGWLQRAVVFLTVDQVSSESSGVGHGMKQQFLQLFLQGCISNLKTSGQTNVRYNQNALQLIRIIHHYLCVEEYHGEQRFTEQMIDDILTLFDLMTIWEGDSGWREMEQLGLSILLAYSRQSNRDLCSIGSARLHSILQTRPVEKVQEACYIIAAVHGTLQSALRQGTYEECSADNNDQYKILIPVMKSLVEKCSEMLSMPAYLPKLPDPSLGPLFYDRFTDYCFSDEWTSFIEKQVLPSRAQYVSNVFDELKVELQAFWAEAHKCSLEVLHERLQSRAAAKAGFERQVVALYHERRKAETRRLANVQAQLKNQNLSALRHWRAIQGNLCGTAANAASVHWKLSVHENFQRMRPKLIPNYNFDTHENASILRDYHGNSHTKRLRGEVNIAQGAAALKKKQDIGDDRLGDEDWNVISKAESSRTDKQTHSEECQLVTIENIRSGILEVTSTHISFIDKEENSTEDFKLTLDQLRQIHFRRYNSQRSALELFLVDQTNYFLNFPRSIRNTVYSRIISLRPPNLIHSGTRSPADMLKSSDLTRRWVLREISNFEYLMQLNTIAGRTYSDLSQYPVFPWILSDYESPYLDINDPSVYRDLSKPVGILNPLHESQVRHKYDTFEDPTGQDVKFHYGTHYSSPANVMHFMVRLEPFTSLHIKLQGNQFDIADRQFHSIPATWKTLINNPNDVKELIPEFFYLPEFLKNESNFDLGKLQLTDVRVHDVELPPWAKSPEDFIDKHRRALESEHVSLNMHNWIDLVFGYKQQGPEAEKAANVFHHCTYEGAVDWDAITDPKERRMLEDRVNNFGQTPCQLLRERHPRRMSLDEAIRQASSFDKPLHLFWFYKQLKANFVEVSERGDAVVQLSVPKRQPRWFMQPYSSDNMVTINKSGLVGVHSWLPYDKSISNYFSFDKDPTFSSGKCSRSVAGPFAADVIVSSQLFAISNNSKLILSVGHWDNSLRVFNVAKNRTMQALKGHSDIATCVCIDSCGQHAMTGSRDCTAVVWSFAPGQQELCSHPMQILYGHRSQVTCVAISAELDVALSGDQNGIIYMHTIRRGTFVRTLQLHLAIGHIALSEVGRILVTSSDLMKQHRINLFSINGHPIVECKVSAQISSIVVHGDHLVTGDVLGELVIRDLGDLIERSSLSLHERVTCIVVTPGASHILASLADGKLIIIGVSKQSFVK